MSIIVLNQGEQAILEDGVANTGYDLRLFTNEVTAGLTPAEIQALDETDFDEADFTGYSAASVATGDWAITQGNPTVAVNTEKSFIASADQSAQNIWGYYITRTSDGAAIWFEQFVAPIVVEFTDDEVQVTPQITLDDRGGNVTVGEMTFWPSDTIPANKLLCDGSAVSRSTYAELFAVIGTTFGSGDGSTTFDLPDMQGVFPLGKATSGTGSALGETGGDIDHTHDLDTSSSAANIRITTGSPGLAMDRKTGLSSYSLTHQTDATGASTSGTSSAGASLQGDSDTANPPYLAGNWVIQALAG